MRKREELEEEGESEGGMEGGTSSKWKKEKKEWEKGTR